MVEIRISPTVISGNMSTTPLLHHLRDSRQSRLPSPWLKTKTLLFLLRSPWNYYTWICSRRQHGFFGSWTPHKRQPSSFRTVSDRLLSRAARVNWIGWSERLVYRAFVLKEYQSLPAFLFLWFSRGQRASKLPTNHATFSARGDGFWYWAEFEPSHDIHAMFTRCLAVFLKLLQLFFHGFNGPFKYIFTLKSCLNFLVQKYIPFYRVSGPLRTGVSTNWTL